MTAMGLLSPGAKPDEPAPIIGDAKADAKALLRSFGVTVVEVVQVETDCILFLGVGRQARTAWMKMADGRVADIAHEGGFLADPPAWVCRRLWSDGGEA